MKILKWLAAILLVVICALIVGCTALAMMSGKYESWDDSNGTIERDIAYGKEKRNVYDLYLPSGQAKNGIFVCIHGGSWMGGDKNELEYVCKRYCKAGYVAASIDYSVIAFQGKNNVSMVQMDKEILSAIKHIKSSLQKKGINVSNMALWGYSAGSQLTLAYAFKHKGDSPYPVRFVVDQVGPADLLTMFPVDGNKLVNIEKQLSDGVAESSIKDKKDIDNMVFNTSGVRMKAGMYNVETVTRLVSTSSPVHLMATTGGVPTIMCYGEKDNLVRPDVRKAVVAAYEKYGVPYDLILFKNSGHDLAGDKDCLETLRETVDKYLQRYFK